MSGVDDFRYVSFNGVATHDRLASSRRVKASAAPGSPRPLAPAGLFAGWVLRQANLDPGAYRDRVFARRIPSCLRILKVSSLEAARARIEERRELLPAVLGALLIGVTGFFRDAAAFEDFRAVVLPWLAARRPRKPRVWSAACSTGAELYSVAILLEEAGLLDGSTLLGTDCRDDAISEAREATYGPPVTDTLPASCQARYFTPVEGQRVRPVARLRSALMWKAADLHVKAEPGPWDVVLWRNAAIYIETAAAARVYRRLAGTLVPGGFLVVGKAERPPFDAGFVQAGHCLYRKHGGPDVS